MRPEPQNRLLASLEPDARARVERHLTRVRLPAKAVLYHAQQRIDAVYFPEDVVIVQLALDAEGSSIEACSVGNEGAAWISAGTSTPSMPCQTLVATDGHALKMHVKDLDTELPENPPLQSRLTTYSHAIFVASIRATACAGLHDASQRCARWILQTLDRVTSDHFDFTHDFLASLIGTRRATISIAMAAFERAGYIETTTRGLIRVTDRPGLASASCECYQIIREYYEKADLRPRRR